MKLPSFIISKRAGKGQWAVVGFLLFAANCLFVSAQKIALITPEANDNTKVITAHFAESFNLIDPDLVEMGIKSQSFQNHYNLSIEESKTLGNAIGCDFFIISKSEYLRRTSLSKPAYFESYAAVYLVSSRTGRLVFWTLKSFEASTANAANEELFASLSSFTKEISNEIDKAREGELKEFPRPDLEELPDETSSDFKSFQSPLPYMRHVPVYKRLANLYGIAATVDATIDLNEDGVMTRIEITRWAGYELDESVIEAIRRMNWRPASRSGKRIPIRVLLRYNFRKIEKDD